MEGRRKKEIGRDGDREWPGMFAWKFIGGIFGVADFGFKLVGLQVTSFSDRMNAGLEPQKRRGRGMPRKRALTIQEKTSDGARHPGKGELPWLLT